MAVVTSVPTAEVSNKPRGGYRPGLSRTRRTGELREDEASWRGHRAIVHRDCQPIGMSAAPSSEPAQAAGAKRSCMTGRAALQLVPSATMSSLVTIIERRTCSGCAHGITSASGHETPHASASIPASSTRPPPGTPSPPHSNTVKSCRFLFVRVWGNINCPQALIAQRKPRAVG